MSARSQSPYARHCSRKLANVCRSWSARWLRAEQLTPMVLSASSRSVDGFECDGIDEELAAAACGHFEQPAHRSN